MRSQSERRRASDGRAGRRVFPGRLAALACLLSIPLFARGAAAQEPRSTPAADDPLAAGRKLFAEALQDEEEGRPVVALDKFQRVRDVRDTAAVEYRIGRCFEDMGRRAEAVEAYEEAVALSRQAATPADVESDALERSLALGRGLARLTITLSPADARVLIDDRPATRIDDVPLSPGGHHIHAAARGATAFDGDLDLPAGGRATLRIALEGVGVGASTVPAGASRTTWGWIAVATGGALLVGAGISLGGREADIQTANRLCPSGACRGVIDPQAQSAVDRARVEGPVALGLGAAGLVCASVGVALLTTGSSSSALVVSPSVGPSGVGMMLRGEL